MADSDKKDGGGLEKDLHHWLKEARERLWSAEFVRKNDERQKGESLEHWHQRRKRNRERVERREEVVEHLKKKLDALRKHKEEEKEQDHGDGGSGNWKDRVGFATYDGKTVGAWMVYWLEKSRQNGWHGYVVSGVRTAAYSQQLCYNMCGNPTCPGRCAGIYSNHNMESNQGYPHGALDVSDYYNFETIQFRIGSPLRNDLPIDPVHFSVSGH